MAQRGDTQTACGAGHINNGFGLLFNWNLARGWHESSRTVLADGVEVASSTFAVITARTWTISRGVKWDGNDHQFPSGAAQPSSNGKKACRISQSCKSAQYRGGNSSPQRTTSV